MQIQPNSDFYSALWDDSPQATLVYGPDGRCSYLSPGFVRLSAQPSEVWLESTVETLWEEIHPEDRGPAQDAWDSLWSGVRTSTVPSLYRMKVRSGDYRLVEVWGLNRLGNDSIGGIVLHFTLIMDRKRAEDMLLSERERLLITLRSIGDGVIATDAQGRITLMNSVTESLTEWTQAEAVGRPLPEVFRIVNEETGVPCANPVERVFESGLVVGLANHTALISRSGKVAIIEDSAAPIRDTSGGIIGAILVFRDVTEAKKTATELLKMQKLESIGVLAGGIAHDFNNLLSAIMGNASLGSLLAEPGSQVSELLLGIQQAARRAGDLTQQLLTFSKGGTPLLKSTRVQDIVREGTRFLLHGTACDYQFLLPDDLDRVMADPGQLGQVVQNLVLNAAQAMKAGGTIVIRASNAQLGESSHLPLPAGAYVRLEFSDNGPGIEPQFLDKIFEPYFTTKATGSGLGLSVVWSIVKNHGGWIQVHSRLGEGTTFMVFLPSSPEEQDDATPVAEVGLPPTKGIALVMDDEEEPRKTLVAMLKHLGFECLEAANGDAALTLMKNRPAADLAVLDLTVRGGRGGREIVKELKELCPRIRVVVTSGYSIDPVLADHRGFGFDGSLRKPFTLADLTESVSRVWDEKL